ncbi:hypothetical protein AB0I76_30200, partial [Micromonospora sp. NPDC049799]
EGAAGWLAPGGHLVVEVSEGQSGALCAAMTAVGLVPVVVRDDERDAVAVTGRASGSGRSGVADGQRGN